MTLEGYLEDLNIKDLLQLLSLSKKSGTLSLNSRDAEGQVCFHNGQVIRAFSSQYQEGLGQLLKKHELVSQEQIDKALVCQKSLPSHQPLGKILAEQFSIPATIIEKIVASQIEKIVFSFFAWQTGRFTFALHTPESFGTAQFNPLDFMLTEGLSSELLALKGNQLSNNTGQKLDERGLEAELARREQHYDLKGVGLLRGMLAELEHPEFGGGIILLILRYASEVMSRAIIFDLRGRQLVGLGQFGFNAQYRNADQMVRMMRLQIDNDSLFERVMRERRGFVAELGDTAAEQQLQEMLGRPSGEVFAGPLLNDGKVIAVLVGDNHPNHEPFAVLDSFQVFLSQAGLALEQALYGKSQL